jgi:3-hydroxyacyl-[acyl-carrier-protein] dehydratase
VLANIELLEFLRTVGILGEPSLDLLPHRPPMRLVEEIVEVIAGESACARRPTRADDWFFQGHFPGDPVVPAIVLVELLAQTGGFAASAEASSMEAAKRLRVAAFGAFKFPAAARPGSTLEAHARVTGRMGTMIRIDGDVTADGVLVAIGGVTLAEVPAPAASERRDPAQNAG